MIPLIGLVGYKGSGKSTVAKYLVHNFGYTRIPFASPLKDMLRVLGLTDDHLYGDLKEEPCDMLLGVTPRHAMQTLGTEWGRLCIHKDIWIDAWKRQVGSCLSGYVVCDDVRFPNEADIIREMGGRVVRIDRGETISDQHESERHIRDIRVSETLYNHGSLEDLFINVRVTATQH